MGKQIYPYRFREMSGLSEFRRALRLGSLHLPISEDLSVLAEPVAIGAGQAPNAICVQPLEGADCTVDGAPTERTRRRYEDFARGGAGMIWFEACAVSRDGRDNPHQMYLHQGSLPAMKTLVREVDRRGEETWGRRPYKVLQLTHSGRASEDEQGRPAPVTAFWNPYLDTQGRSAEVVSDERLAKLEDEMVSAAVLAAEAGFDAVDLKLCHNYLTRELLAAFTRQGQYGGSFENRTRFVRHTGEKIRKTLGNQITLAARINAYDAIAYPYGWGMRKSEGEMAPDLTEPKRLVLELSQQGFDLFNISSMIPRCLPYGEGYLATLKNDGVVFPYAGVESLLQATQELKHMAPGAKVVATGLSWMEQFAPFVGAGGVQEGWFDLAGFGRQALVDPFFAARILRKEPLDQKKLCVFCDGCYRLLERGEPVHCVVRKNRND